MIRLFILFFCFFGIFVSCKEKPPELTPGIMVSTREIKAEATSGKLIFHVKSNTSWTTQSNSEWCRLVPATGSSGTVQVDIELDENTSAESREAIVAVKSGELSEQIRIIQSGADILNVSSEKFEAAANGQEFTLDIEASADYSSEISSTWIRQVSSDGRTMRFSVFENPNHFAREGYIRFQLGTTRKTIAVLQTGKPLHIAADKTGMPNDASILGSKIMLGWNLGNSMEACSDEFTASETLWGNPRTTKELIDFVKKSGFNAVRIPTAWSGYIEDRATHKIKDDWIMRVREVVNYCLENDMYAIINIHWDGGWLENNPTYARQSEVNAKQKALWQQIAVAFRDYDERLLFAGTNEVHANYNKPTKEHLEVQMSYNQTFVDAVRSTGGKNAWRVLVAQGYNTNIQYTYESLVLPKDPAANRMMAEIHYYDPYDFTLDNGANAKYLWGREFKGNPNVSDWGQEEWADEAFGLMKEKFTSKGIPVILGEYAATYRGKLTGTAMENHRKARSLYMNYITRTARANGLIPFYWDNGGTGDNSSGLFNRNNLTVAHPEVLNALIQSLK